MSKDSVDRVYSSLIFDILDKGKRVFTRNGNCKRLFALKYAFDYTPLISVRVTAWKNALREWEWFMSGSNAIEKLHPDVRKWWEPWVNEYGEVPYNYSEQFRGFAGDDGSSYTIGCVDQINYLIKGIKEHPYSRRNVITTWNTAEMVLPDCPITNCHGTVIQTFVDPDDNKLHLVTYQRSVDTICGLPHNWIQYWAFLMWLAHRGGRKVGALEWIGGDVHIYQEHEDLARKISSVNSFVYPTIAPKLVYTPTSEDFKADDFKLDELTPYHPIITESAKMIV